MYQILALVRLKLKRATRSSIENPLVREIPEGKFGANDAVRVDSRGGILRF